MAKWNDSPSKQKDVDEEAEEVQIPDLTGGSPNSRPHVNPIHAHEGYKLTKTKYKESSGFSSIEEI